MREGLGTDEHRSPHVNLISFSNPKPWFLLGLFLICMCVLMLQIIETRILSVVSYYHLAFFFDQHSHVRHDSGISIRLFQREVVPVRATVRKFGLDLWRLCDRCRAFDTPSDLNRIDGRRKIGISNDGAVMAQADRHSGRTLFLRWNGYIAGPDAKPLGRLHYL
jgi:hypothetical protein